MKQIFTLLFVLSLSIAGFGQTQTFKNQPLISKITATWCTNCGNWGWDFKTAILEEIPAEDATFVALHFSGDLLNETSGPLASTLNSFGQPQFFLNNTNIGASFGNWSNKIDELKASIEQINAEIPLFGIEMHGYPGASANEIVTEISLHVNEAVDGEYYIGTYLIDNKLNHSQAGAAGSGGSAEHKKVILEEFSGTPFGRLIGNGSISEGVMDFSITSTFSDVPQEQADVAVIIWEKTGNDHTIVNTAVVESVNLLSSNDEVNWVVDAKSYYVQDAINIDLKSEKAIGEYKINVLNANGQLISTTSNRTNDNALMQQIDASGLTTGSYFINVLTSNGVWTDKVMVVK